MNIKKHGKMKLKKHKRSNVHSNVINDDLSNLGLSVTMGPRLRANVETQLIEDLKFYEPNIENVVFDWSFSCVEGKSGKWLDGSLDRYSGITLLNSKGDVIAEGWMDFILDLEHNYFKVYWAYLDIVKGDEIIVVKNSNILPEHIREGLPDYILSNLDKCKLIT